MYILHQTLLVKSNKISLHQITVTNPSINPLNLHLYNKLINYLKFPVIYTHFAQVPDSFDFI